MLWRTPILINDLNSDPLEESMAEEEEERLDPMIEECTNSFTSISFVFTNDETSSGTVEFKNDARTSRSKDMVSIFL